MLYGIILYYIAKSNETCILTNTEKNREPVTYIQHASDLCFHWNRPLDVFLPVGYHLEYCQAAHGNNTNIGRGRVVARDEVLRCTTT